MEPLAWHVLLVQITTFVIGALLLWRIAYQPIRAILAERRERIAAEHARAEAARTAAEAAHRELRDRMIELEDDHRRQRNAAEGEARQLRDEVLAAARAEAQKLLAAAREQGRRERAERDAELRKDVARLAVAMARKVAGVSLSSKDRSRLVARVIKDLPKRLEGSA